MPKKSSASPEPADSQLDPEELGFEEAYRALETTVEDLEAGELSLEASLEAYERGVALAERCNQLLAAAELRIQEVNANGEPAGDMSV